MNHYTFPYGGMLDFSASSAEPPEKISSANPPGVGGWGAWGGGGGISKYYRLESNV